MAHESLAREHVLGVRDAGRVKIESHLLHDQRGRRYGARALGA